MMNKKTMDMRKATKDQELRKLALLSERELMMELRTSEKGLSNEDAEKRLEEFGPNEVSAQKPTPAIILFLSAFKDPFVYVLALLMVVSTLTKDFEAAIVMGVMILASVLIAFIQEYRSQKASLDLKELIENTAALALVGRYEIGYKWLKSLYKTGFEGDDTFFYWLSCSAYFTGHTEFAETIWRKVESQYPGEDRPAPWIERREALPSSVEQRLAAYYISSTKGETEHLEAVIRSKRITAPFENHFVKLLLNGDSAAADVTEDALFAYQTVKLLEQAEKEEMKTEVMSCWVFHVIQQIRAAAPLKNERGWAAAICYIWKEAHGKHDTKKDTAARFGISPATLTKYMKYIDDILE